MKKNDSRFMEDLDPEDELYNLWLLLQRMRRATTKARRIELFGTGITPEQSGVLHVIRALGNNATITSISRVMFIEPHTAGGIVERMEAKGLLKRVKDSQRKNTVKVVLTEKGDHGYWQSAKRESVRTILSTLTNEERDQLWELSRKVVDESLKYASNGVKKRTKLKKAAVPNT